jgi:hypothetical protein
MKAYSPLILAALALGAVAVACAASGNDEETTPSPDAGTVAPPSPDSGEADVEAEAAVEPPGPRTCSDAGWCVTSLPNADLVMKDIWTLPGRAFAIADSPTLGVKVLEWTDENATWRYIDDGTQNESGRGRYAGKIWAPGDNDVYFAVSPGYVFHGTRAAANDAAWSWVHHRLPNSSSFDSDDGNPVDYKVGSSARRVALGVRGTSNGEIYAWFKNAIFRWTSSDGGAPEWIAEYTANDAAAGQQIYIFAATGAGPDVWFSGARARGTAGCAILVRKTLAGYERVADGALTSASSPCTPLPNKPMIGGAEGWLTDLQVSAPDELVALKGGRDAVRIRLEGDTYSVSSAPIPADVTGKGGLNSLFVDSESIWLSGMGLIIQGTNVWNGGTFKISPSSLTGASISQHLYQIRGMSNTNLWAIGANYALHKTTP